MILTTSSKKSKCSTEESFTSVEYFGFIMLLIPVFVRVQN